ncbi:MAG: hypothetical protein JNL43_00935 [Flavobacteriales bacterium]|nr:hypothetical protein [Flavobacteriales bacterium]
MYPRFLFALLVISAFGCGERVVLPACPIDAPVAVRTERGITYHEHLQDALRCSRETSRPVLLLFDGYAQSNRACWDVLGDKEVQALIHDRLVLCVLMIDDREVLSPEDLVDFPQLNANPTTLGQRNSSLEAEFFNNVHQPLFTLVNADFAPLAEPMGYVPKENPELLVNWIMDALKHNVDEPSETGVTITKELEAKILGKIRSKCEESISPYYAAARLRLDAIIDPLETRTWISIGIEAASQSPATREFNMGVLQT